MKLFRKRKEKQAQTIAEIREGVEHAVYKPYISDGEKWIPLDADEAVAILREREKAIKELLKHIEEEQNGET